MANGEWLGSSWILDLASTSDHGFRREDVVRWLDVDDTDLETSVSCAFMQPMSGDVLTRKLPGQCPLAGGILLWFASTTNDIVRQRNGF